jgi:quercetin dioxygenase-like cupin family protein
MPGQSHEETLLHTPDVRIRIMTLEKGNTIPWHIHTQVTDHTVCLEGEIEVHLRDPEDSLTLTPGQYHEIPAKRPHTLLNRGEASARYLLIQGVGAYDFVRIEKPQTES